MEQGREQKLAELFEVAVHLSAAERDGFFDRHCDGDEALRRELELLLEHDEEDTKSFLRSPLQIQAPTPRAGPQSLPEHVGPYLILAKIGEGGMGSVYLGEDQRSHPRKVAVKVMRSGLESEDARARFHVERRILSRMEHPGIATILDDGRTPEGHPYIVMEYVDGLPLLQYCDERRLGLRSRLSLFRQICGAVQHAHQKGVIHRDLKPSNILVEEVDGEPRPKVIDFGVAVTAEPNEARLTAADQVLGTYHYMSPEQALPGARDIDTRSDVYSLGVVLYELLTGVLPVDRDTMRDKKPAEIHSLLWDLDPPAPSLRVHGLLGQSEDLAEQRSTTVREWGRELSGDLDWITLRAMAKEPERRYRSPMDCASDIQRFLEHRPVEAGPPDFLYRARKLFRRHRAAALALVIVVVAILLGGAGLTWGMITASRERDEAQARTREAQEARGETQRALVLAERRSAHAHSVAKFLADTIALADPSVALEPGPDLYRLLRERSRELPDAFDDYPEGEALVRTSLGRAFESIGDLHAAKEHLEKSYELIAASPTSNPIERYEAARRYGRVLEDSGSRGAFEKRVQTHELGLEILWRASPELGQEIEVLQTTDESHAFLKAVGHIHELSGTSFAEGDPRYLILADAFEFIGLYQPIPVFELSIALLQEALNLRAAALDPLHPEIARTQRLLVAMFNADGRFEESERLLAEALDTYLRVLPPDHWAIAVARSALADIWSMRGEVEHPEGLLVDNHRQIVAKLGLSSREGIESCHRVLNHFVRYGPPEAAVAYRQEFTKAIAFARSLPLGVRWTRDALGEHVEVYDEYAGFDDALWDFDSPDRTSRAEEHLRRLLKLLEPLKEQDEHAAIILARRLGTMFYFEDGLDPELTFATQHAVLDVLRVREERFADELVEIWWNLADYYADMRGDAERAEECLREAIAIHERSTAGRELPSFNLDSALAQLLVTQGLEDEATELLEQRWNQAVDEHGVFHLHSRAALWNLEHLFTELEAPQRIGPFLDRHLRDAVGQSQPDRILELVRACVDIPDLPPETYAGALDAAESAQRITPDDTATDLMYGAALLRAGDPLSALEQLESVEDASWPWGTLRAGFVALAQLELGRTDAARETVESASGDSAALREARERLDLAD